MTTGCQLPKISVAEFSSLFKIFLQKKRLFCREQLCFCDGEKKEPDEEELVSLSKRLVETAVIKAVQQYLEETQTKANQNKNGQKITFKDTDPNNGNKK
ncbi:A-kinase anchor protein 7 [Scyliorhinus canicula]|uniref:A-kinase anchor protein 7 n=1 Tax=Scyliorhinus canicula TaxID=7830 RepID=UPI0018F3AAF6|nr:A-kinase anchor protein 7 [Scyliorhinus canicula]